MKKGRWIGSLLLAMLACIAELRGEEVQWQAVANAPRTQSAGTVSLTAPNPLPRERIAMTPESGPSGIMQASFETSVPIDNRPAASPSAPPRPPQEIIAVSAPVTGPAALPTENPDEQIESPFAVDRPSSRAAASPYLPQNGGVRGVGSGIVRTSANVVVPGVATSSQVPMVPGWEAPVDTSWGVRLPTGPLPADPIAQEVPAFSPIQPRLYGSAEYLLWWVQGQSVPVLATTAAFSNSPLEAGLADPTTQILFGGKPINGRSPFSGGRFTVGYWLDCEQTKALEITGFFLGPRSAGFFTDSSMNQVIGRPFVTANNGVETAQLTAQPGVVAGALTIQAPTSLWGLAGNLRCLLCCGCNYRVSLLAGFRNLNLNESLTITENVLGLPNTGLSVANQQITVIDRFATQNHFYGGNLGADARWYWGRFSVDVRGQVALGDNAQILDISGGQQFIPGLPTPGGVAQHFTGGLLALPSNIGHFRHNVFSAVPEISVNLGYQFLPNLRGFVGYNFLYWTNVIRPGTSIDRSLDVTQIPNFALNPEPAPVPGLHPAPVFHQVGLWAQGLTFGLEFVY